jgi:hypothetical protein
VNKRRMLLHVHVSLIALVMILGLSVFNVVFPPVRAQTVVATKAYMSVEPNPIGVITSSALQFLNVSMRIEPPPPSPTDRFTGLIIHDLSTGEPGGGFGPYFTDSNGSAFVNSLAFTHVGTYKLQLIYAGESFANGTIVYEGATSAVITLNVTAAIPTPTLEQTPSPASTPASTPEATPTPSPSPTPTPIPTPSPTPNPESKPFQTTFVSASTASVAFVGVGLIVYYKKYRVNRG